MGLALKALLVSPDFLFRIERDDAAETRAHPLDPYELASRLSYFVWSSMPDDELLASAARGGLRKPEVLEQQVRRLLKDPRSAGLVENFTGQWLETRRLESVNPDRERFPDFEDYLRDSMRREPEEFFRYIVSNDRSILDFLDAGYTFLNERLARHYGIPGVTGPEFRKVDLTGTTRGGCSPRRVSLRCPRTATARLRSCAASGSSKTFSIRRRPRLLPTSRCWTRRRSGRPRPCAPSSNSIEAMRSALRATPGWIPSALPWRTTTQSARGDPRMESFPSMRREPCRTASLPERRRVESHFEERPGRVCPRPHRKAADICAGPGTRAIRPAGRQKHRRTLRRNDYRFSTLVLEIVKSLPFQMRRGDRGKDDHHA